MMLRPRHLSLVLLIFSLSGCNLLGLNLTPLAVVPESAQATTTKGQVSCPQPAADEKLYGGLRTGFFFLYPAGFYVYPSKAIILRTLPTGSGSDAASGTMTITYEDLAGRTLQAYADSIIAQNTGSGSPYQSPFTLDSGYPAILLVGFDGPPPWRAILLEHGGLAFLISFQPWDDSQPAAKADLERLYMSVINSWLFTY